MVQYGKQFTCHVLRDGAVWQVIHHKATDTISHTLSYRQTHPEVGVHRVPRHHGNREKGPSCYVSEEERSDCDLGRQTDRQRERERERERVQSHEAQYILGRALL